jgi:cytochrome P450
MRVVCILTYWSNAVLRTHCFQTTKDDVLPLSAPIILPDGRTTDHVVLSANTTVNIPIKTINRMRCLWGADAYEFKPERWLNGGENIPALAKEIQGHRYLATFAHGPRT